MEVNLPYYVNTMKLHSSKALFPLFEAISNSIDAIEERNESENKSNNGDIWIELIRDPQDPLYKEQENRELIPIRDIKIKDNGIGFTPDNYAAFEEFSSEKKRVRGGKGLGRICWLKVYKKVEISSTYKADGKNDYINFEFKCEDNPIEVINHEKETNIKDISTTVTLHDCKKTFIYSIPKKRLIIAEEIITHFLPYFMSSNLPNIILQENGIEDLSVNQIFEEFISEKGERRSFILNDMNFDIVHAKTRYHSQRNKDHRVYYIANGRVVEKETISQEKVANIPQKLNIHDENHIYVGFIESKYLDENVNQARDSFDIPKSKEDGTFPNIIDLDTIQHSIYSSVGLYLDDFIKEACKEKEEKIREFINEEAPSYSYLYKHHKEKLEKIPLVNIEKGKLERELHLIHESNKQNLKEEVNEILSLPEGEIDPEDYYKRISELLENLNPIGKADLAEYIVQRKVILDLLEKALRRDQNGKYAKEEAIHGYIFPIRKSSDDITFEEHNLWLVDERLSFNTYIASDKPFNQIKGLNLPKDSNGQKRPDIFAIAFATVEANEINSPFKSLDLIEFKRPMRDDYTDEENPYTQITEYLNIIRGKTAITKNGRPFSIDEGGVIYCHIICDFTPNLHQLLKREDFKQVGNEDWYIKFHNAYKSIIEVKSFDYIMRNAIHRNQILFRKLGIS